MKKSLLLLISFTLLKTPFITTGCEDKPIPMRSTIVVNLVVPPNPGAGSSGGVTQAIADFKKMVESNIESNECTFSMCHTQTCRGNRICDPSPNGATATFKKNSISCSKSGNTASFDCSGTITSKFCNCCCKKRSRAKEECLPGEDCNVCEESLVSLKKFTATPQNNSILLTWITKTELDSQGFKMWRAIPKLDNYCGCSKNIEDYTQIQVLDKKGKPILIPAKGSITSGHNYSYLDKDAKPGIAYCYALEDIDSKGESEFYFKYIAFTQPKQDKEAQ